MTFVYNAGSLYLLLFLHPTILQIKTKTVAQCVEFYYTYKKQVKIGRNGTLIFGDVDTTTERAVKDEAEVDIKVTDTKQKLRC